MATSLALLELGGPEDGGSQDGRNSVEVDLSFEFERDMASVRVVCGWRNKSNAVQRTVCEGSTKQPRAQWMSLSGQNEYTS